MALSQNSVLRSHLAKGDEAATEEAFKRYREYFLPKIDNIKTSKEEQYQYGFLEDIFVKVLAYTLNPAENFISPPSSKTRVTVKRRTGRFYAMAK